MIYTRKKELHLGEIFPTYANEHKAALSAVGVIATVAALFLNINETTFGVTLRNLQLLLLLFLVLSLIFLTISTFSWIAKNADSWFGGLIISTLALLIIKIVDFISENFRDELNQYLFWALISVAFIVGTFLHRIKIKTEINIQKQFSDILLKAVLFGLTTFLFIYVFRVVLDIYTAFYQNKPITNVLLRSPLFDLPIWLMAVWAMMVQFCGGYFFTKERARLWLSILLLVFLGLSFLSIVFLLGFGLYLDFNS